MKKSLITGLFALGLTVMMVSSVTAQSADDAVSASNGTSVTGGEVVQQDVGVTTKTDDWAGLFGQIETGKVLETSGGKFFEWSAAEPSSMQYVYAVTTGDTPDATSLSSTSNPSNLISSDGGADSADNTYSTDREFDGLGTTINTRSVKTFDSNGDSSWTTFLLSDGNSNPVFAAKASANSDAFNGDSVDYQMLLPDQDGQGTSYDFYVELE